MLLECYQVEVQGKWVLRERFAQMEVHKGMAYNTNGMTAFLCLG